MIEIGLPNGAKTSLRMTTVTKEGYVFTSTISSTIGSLVFKTTTEVVIPFCLN